MQIESLSPLFSLWMGFLAETRHGWHETYTPLALHVWEHAVLHFFVVSLETINLILVSTLHSSHFNIYSNLHPFFLVPFRYFVTPLLSFSLSLSLSLSPGKIRSLETSWHSSSSCSLRWSLGSLSPGLAWRSPASPCRDTLCWLVSSLWPACSITIRWGLTFLSLFTWSSEQLSLCDSCDHAGLVLGFWWFYQSIQTFA